MNHECAGIGTCYSGRIHQKIQIQPAFFLRGNYAGLSGYGALDAETVFQQRVQDRYVESFQSQCQCVSESVGVASGQLYGLVSAGEFHFPYIDILSADIQG